MHSPSDSASPVPLAALICERDATMAGITLPRLQSNVRDGGTFTIFEDGSLTEKSAETILSKLRNVRLIRRRELDEQVAESLRHRPNSRRYWTESPLALKLLGIPATLKFDFFFFDSDILTTKPFLLRPLAAKSATTFVFMQDIADGYSGRSVDLIFRHGLKPRSRLNSGIMAMPATGYDPDFIEWFLGVPEFRNFPFLLEQTCWSVMPRRHPVEYVDPRLIWCADDRREADGQTMGIHYIQHTKSRLAGDAERFPDRPDLSAVELTSIVAPKFGVLRMARNFTHRLFRR